MSVFARIVAVAVGLVTLAFAGAGLVRQAAMAADAGVSWPVAGWWSELTAAPSAATTAAAVGAAALAALLAALAYRQVFPGVPPQVVEYAVPGGTARLSVPALGKAVRRRFEALLPGASVTDVGVARDGQGWSLRVEADLPVCDLRQAQQTLLQGLRDDLRRVAGIEIVRLDVVARSIRPAAEKVR